MLDNLYMILSVIRERSPVDFTALGKWIIYVGIGLAAFGLLIWLLSRLGSPLGHLPGDIRIQREGHSFYLPLGSSVVLSVILTVALNILIRLPRK